MIRRSLFLLSVLFVAGCGPKRPPFLRYPEHRTQRMGDRNPRSPFPDAIRMTKVKRADYETYLARKAEGKLIAEEHRGKYVYFATSSVRHIPAQANGQPGAYIHVIERYKAKLPSGEKAP